MRRLLMRKRRQKKRNNIPERTDSGTLYVEKVNAEMDDRAAETIIYDAIGLVGSSLDLNRFLAYFNEGESQSNSGNSSLVTAIIKVLETDFGFGDELLAKLIIETGMKFSHKEEFDEEIQQISNQYRFNNESVDRLYNLIIAEKNRVFKPEEVEASLDGLKKGLEKFTEKTHKCLEERGKERMLTIIVDAVEYWGIILDVINNLQAELISQALTQELDDLVTTKKKLGKHIANLFSTISYIRASLDSWNIENASASMEEANRSLFLVTLSMLDSIRKSCQALRENRSSGVVPVRSSKMSQGDQKKLAKFFGAQPPTIKRTNSMDKLIQDDSFSRDLFFTMEGQIKGGSLARLVERLTHHSITDVDYVFAFLVTYKSFTDAKTLFRLLIERFRVQPPDHLVPAEKEFYLERKIKPLQLRILDVLSHWIEMETETFRNDEDLRASLIEFIIMDVRTNLPSAADQIDSILNGTLERKVSATTLDKTPHPIMPKSLRTFSLTSIDPLELARQLTLIDFGLFEKIKPKEFFKLAWSKKDGQLVAPNITALIKRSTQLTSFVCSKILEEPEIQARADILKHFILVADRCRHLQNYNSLMAINGALMSSSIHRLIKTWRFLGKREMQLTEELKTLMNYRRNFGDYRDALKQAKPPCIPFLGLYLTDLTFIEDGNKDFLANSDFINFDKRTKTAKVIQEIYHFQRHPYHFQAVPQIEDYLTNLAQYEKNEEEFYEISQQIEKKESDGEVLNRILSQNGFL